MIISTLYLPETAANVQYQPAPTGGISTAHKTCADTIGIVGSGFW
jgi:hypothetical protein